MRMRPSPALLTVVVAAAVALTGAAPAAADTPFVRVIQPGAEPLAGEMLLGEIGGCKATGVALDRTRIVARYACAAGEIAVELHHLSDDAGAAATTAQFAVVPGAGSTLPPRFLDELTRRIKAKEGTFRWVAAEAPGLGKVAPVDGPTPTAAEPGLSPEQAEAFVAAAQHYRNRKYTDAFDSFVKLARQTPRHGVLGMIVASLASTSPERARVDALRAEADAHPDDTLAQFIAGVAAHYCGHRNGRSIAEKQELYRLAIQYLARTRPAFDFEPRVYVYLAVSHFRLGQQKEAEQLIEAAIPLAQNDPDVYYCRAEIFQRVDVKRSIADIERYLAMTGTLQQQGVPVSEDKHARVKEMLGYLKSVERGERPAAKDDALFDPVLPGPTGTATGGGGAGDAHGPSAATQQSGGAPAAAAPIFTSPRTFLLLLLGVVGVVAAAGLAMARRARRKSG